METSIVPISKSVAAIDQLVWAMRLLIDHRAYPSACTLAGAAEELLGKQLGEMAVFKDLKSALSNAKCVTPNVAGEALNFARNWMKHSGKGDDVLAHD